MHESNMASYFSEAGNLNGRNADLCSDVAGPSSSDSGYLLELQIGQTLSTFTISPTTSTTDHLLGFERDGRDCLSGVRARVTSLCIRSI